MYWSRDFLIELPLVFCMLLLTTVLMVWAIAPRTDPQRVAAAEFAHDSLIELASE